MLFVSRNDKLIIFEIGQQYVIVDVKYFEVEYVLLFDDLFDSVYDFRPINFAVEDLLILLLH
jgi:hypothetical protein